MAYRNSLMREKGIELSPAEAELEVAMLKAQACLATAEIDKDSDGKCIMCGKPSDKLRYECCSFPCFLKRCKTDPKLLDQLNKEKEEE
jgi:hypothetical protein